ncbi:hypothetical protein B484DRAFT_248622 [Ochromonadaceae sp. CCMP2298]|nr:hypothetical protein B484DRAFT_248622 [Ochromonadaceae sp. CCMP2298]
MDSAAAIVGTASKGISHLSGDADYVRRRALKRQQNRANHGGIFEGMRDGGECVISGISSGMTGLVSKPIEEASKHGFQGFFRGLSLGIIGAAVKPVLGLSDGITSVAQGISNQVDPHMKACHVRPPRALEPSAIDPSYLVITPLNMQAAFAQAFVLKRAKQNHYEDSFLRYIPLPTEGENIILSSVYVYWRRRGQLWGRVWANISHCVYLGDSVGIMLYSGGSDGGASLVVIPCLNAQTAKNVYSALAQNVARMGNPTIVIPADVVFQAHTGKGSTASAEGEHTLLQDGRKTAHSTQDALRLALDESLLGALDGYRFGSANGRVLRNITGSEEDVLLRAKHYLEKEIVSWKYVDEQIWQLLWEWGCVHSHLSACRCSVTVLINRSDSPIQITRVQLVLGRNVLIIGSSDTGYEVESRSLLPEGMVIVFICAFPESPLDIGHLKANINTAAFSAMVASTQRESFCEAKGGFTIGFLEKTVSEWWSKYVIIIS